MNILKSANWRYATKAFDPNRTLSHEQIEALKAIIRLSPSSINFQPWHFLVATSTKAKTQIAAACPGAMAYNAKKIEQASMIIVFCAKTQATHADLIQVIEQEHMDNRYPTKDAKKERLTLLSRYIDQLNTDPQQAKQWLDKQTYIALGQVLLAAADMGIDSVPIEGFQPAIIDKTFGLLEKGYHSTVMAAFGFRSEEDFNEKLPKSRFSSETLFTDI